MFPSVSLNYTTYSRIIHPNYAQIIKVTPLRHSQSIDSQVILEFVFVTINTKHYNYDYHNSTKASGEKGALLFC